MAPTQPARSKLHPYTLGPLTHDTPLDVRAGVVAPAVCYVITDGAPWDGKYKKADYFMGWYGG